MIETIDLHFDMAGCPNNCRHCWIKTTGKGFVSESDVRLITKDFKELANEIGVYTWYLEPDYLPNYKELWKLEQELSTKSHEHFELLSDWRIIKDHEYLRWAYDIGVRTCQLTFFGMEETTNKMTGRENAFQEMIEVTDRLILNGISPRYQLFIYDFNIEEITKFLDYIKLLKINERCKANGIEFSLFAHTGSCVGNAMSLYDKWLTEENVSKLPNELVDATKLHFSSNDISEILGLPENVLIEQIIRTNDIVPIEVDKVILYIDGKLDVYPHFAVQKPWWKIGNLKNESAEKIVDKYLSGETIGQIIRKKIPLSDIVKMFGDSNSRRMFHKSDYIEYITERYLEWHYSNNLDV